MFARTAGQRAAVATANLIKLHKLLVELRDARARARFAHQTPSVWRGKCCGRQANRWSARALCALRTGTAHCGWCRELNSGGSAVNSRARRALASLACGALHCSAVPGQSRCARAVRVSPLTLQNKVMHAVCGRAAVNVRGVAREWRLVLAVQAMPCWRQRAAPRHGSSPLRRTFTNCMSPKARRAGCSHAETAEARGRCDRYNAGRRARAKREC